MRAAPQPAQGVQTQAFTFSDDIDEEAEFVHAAAAPAVSPHPAASTSAVSPAISAKRATANSTAGASNDRLGKAGSRAWTPPWW